MLVTAGAGSGKTRVLTQRIAYIIEKYDYSDGEIIALTFTNKAAKEMKDRINGFLAPRTEFKNHFGTFHGWCASFLRKHINKLKGYNRDFSIYDRNDSQKVIKSLVEKEDIKTVEWHISNMKNQGLSINEYDASGYEDVIEKYQQILRESNALDFDDLLVTTLEVLETAPEVLDTIRKQNKYVFVDEFQDTNDVQYKIVELIAREHKNIMVVGDEDQCIYTWRGASTQIINHFRRDFPDYKIYKLEQNFRSSRNIVTLANRLVANNKNRLEKVLFSDIDDGVIVCQNCYNEREEAQRVVEKIVTEVRAGRAQYSDFAVLMRINALTRHFEEQLLAYNVPHVVWGGFKFYERAEIKTVVNYLRILVNPRDDVALFDIINFPRRGVGASTIEKIKEIATNEKLSCFEVIQNAEKYNLPKKAVAGIQDFVRVIQKLRDMNDNFGLFSLGGCIIATIGLEDTFDKRKEDEMNRLENIYQLERAIKDFACENPDTDLSAWLQNVSLISDQEITSGGVQRDDSANAVVISTVHGAKGLEFKTVFVVGMEDGLFPLARSKNSDAEMEEERRLLYVAITRARERLFVSYCSSRFLHGEVKNLLPSLFLKQCGFDINKEDAFDRFGGVREQIGFQNENQSRLDINQTPGIQPKPDTAESLGFSVGDRVRHEKFGDGTVEAVIDKNIIKIKFDVVGVKMLSLAFATLTKI